MKDFDLERELNKLEITPYKLSKEINSVIKRGFITSKKK